MGIVVLAIVGVAIGIMVWLIRLVSSVGPWSESPRGRRIAGLITLVVVSTIYSSPVILASYYEWRFKRLCHSQTEPLVYGVVDANGLYATRLVRLEGDFGMVASEKFILLERINSVGGRAHPYYRIFLAPGNDPNCLDRDPSPSPSLKAQAEQAMSKYPGFPASKCLAFARPATTISPIAIIRTSAPYKGSRRITRYSHYVMDRESGLILAEQKQFMLQGGHLYSLFHPQPTCPVERGVAERLLELSVSRDNKRIKRSSVDTLNERSRHMTFAEALEWGKSDEVSVIRLAMREPGTWLVGVLLENGFTPQGLYNVAESSPAPKNTSNVSSLLRIALESNRVSIAKLLVGKGAKLYAKNGTRDENLFVAVANTANAKTLDYLLTEGRWTPDTLRKVAEKVGRYGNSPAELSVLLHHRINPDWILASAVYDKTDQALPKVKLLVESGGHLFPKGKPIHGIKYALKNGPDDLRQYLNVQWRHRDSG